MEVGGDGAERQVFAARALGFLYTNRTSIAVATLTFAFTGGVVGWLKPGTWCSTAVVEIGFLAPRNLIESPVVARERISGSVAEASRRFSGRLEVDVAHQRGTRAQELTRLIIVKVCAESSSVAEAVLADGVNRFIARHAELHAYDTEVLGRERILYDEEERRVHEGLLAGQAEEVSSPSPAVSDGPLRPRLLAAALLNVQKERNDLTASMATHRLPKSRVVDGPTPPVPGPSMLWFFSLGGALIGMWLAIGRAGLRAVLAGFGLSRKPESTPIDEPGAHSGP